MFYGDNITPQCYDLITLINMITDINKYPIISIIIYNPSLFNVKCDIIDLSIK